MGRLRQGHAVAVALAMRTMGGRERKSFDTSRLTHRANEYRVQYTGARIAVSNHATPIAPCRTPGGAASGRVWRSQRRT